MQKIIGACLLGLICFSACSSKKEIILLDKEAYVSKYKPIIGSRNNDVRTILDMGMAVKVWVAPYKDQYGVLVAGHDIYVWLERPDFIPGTSVPQIDGDNKGIPNQVGKIPFTLSPEEIDRSDLKNDATIQKYVNETYDSSSGSIMMKIDQQNKAIEEDRENMRKEIKEREKQLKADIKRKEKERKAQEQEEKKKK